MRTELDIVYAIINELRANDYNNDEVLTESYVRALIQKYRGSLLYSFYKKGDYVSDEVFQSKVISFKHRQANTFGQMGQVSVAKANDEYESDIPKIIELDLNGFYLEYMGISIPVMKSSEFELSKVHKITKNNITSKREHNKIIVYAPFDDECTTVGTNAVLRDAIFSTKNGKGTQRKFNLELKAVFHNPEDADNYDWENDIYPFPSELFDHLFTTIMQKEFTIMVDASKLSDEIQNNRKDYIRYHDNSKIYGNNTSNNTNTKGQA